jgi:hypothetical protein
MRTKKRKISIYALALLIICNILFGTLPEVTAPKSILYFNESDSNYSYLEYIRTIEKNSSYIKIIFATFVYPGYYLGKWISNHINNNERIIPRGKPHERKIMVQLCFPSAEFFITKYPAK